MAEGFIRKCDTKDIEFTKIYKFQVVDYLCLCSTIFYSRAAVFGQTNLKKWP